MVDAPIVNQTFIFPKSRTKLPPCLLKLLAFQAMPKSLIIVLLCLLNVYIYILLLDVRLLQLIEMRTIIYRGMLA